MVATLRIKKSNASLLESIDRIMEKTVAVTPKVRCAKKSVERRKDEVKSNH